MNENNYSEPVSGWARLWDKAWPFALVLGVVGVMAALSAYLLDSRTDASRPRKAVALTLERGGNQYVMRCAGGDIMYIPQSADRGAGEDLDQHVGIPVEGQPGWVVPVYRRSEHMTITHMVSACRLGLTFVPDVDVPLPEDP